MNYGFIGAGNMATAMIKGLIHAGIASKSIYVSSPHSAAKLAEKLHIQAADPETITKACDIVIIAFLPNQLHTMSNSLNLDGKIVISVLAQVTVADLDKAFPTAFNVRSLPNINSAIGQGSTALAFSNRLNEHQIEVVQNYWHLLGTTSVLDEQHFAIFSAIAGSGPAFVLKFIDALTQAGINNGLDSESAATIAASTVAGTTETLQNSNRDAVTLMNNVASPGGSTRAGLDDFEKNNFDAIVNSAIAATVNHKHA
ncbi:pyrroline-5-carboxylate reductase [Leuconostoc koreense]|nr:pyrroline-5-carboxylate reductase [Leuconostoc mesenteroides]QGM24777.1 pyrroline-5-carboxylate reductase [Leuconostoc mesenteroides subsp. mesenteroides]